MLDILWTKIKKFFKEVFKDISTLNKRFNGNEYTLILVAVLALAMILYVAPKFGFFNLLKGLVAAAILFFVFMWRA